MELQRIRAKAEVPMASTGRKELALKMFLNQGRRAVWILGFGPAVLSEKGWRWGRLRRQAGWSPGTARKSEALYSFAAQEAEFQVVRPEFCSGIVSCTVVGRR